MIEVLIAEDYAIVRRGLAAILSEHPDIGEPGQVSDYPGLLRELRTGGWQVALVDVRMAGGNILDALSTISRASPEVAVLVLTNAPADQFAVRVLRAGAKGYLEKDVPPDELVAAIRTVAAGERYVGRAVGALLAREVARGPAGTTDHTLSDREFQVVRMIASGRAVGEIADELHVSPKTVSTYRSRALKKLGLRSNVELTRYALQNDLLR